MTYVVKVAVNIAEALAGAVLIATNPRWLSVARRRLRKRYIVAA